MSSSVCSFFYILFTLIEIWLQALLVSGGNDGLLVVWSADHAQDSRELVPKLSIKVTISLFFRTKPCRCCHFIKIYLMTIWPYVQTAFSDIDLRHPILWFCALMLSMEGNTLLWEFGVWWSCFFWFYRLSHYFLFWHLCFTNFKIILLVCFFLMERGALNWM